MRSAPEVICWNGALLRWRTRSGTRADAVSTLHIRGSNPQKVLADLLHRGREGEHPGLGIPLQPGRSIVPLCKVDDLSRSQDPG